MKFAVVDQKRDVYAVAASKLAIMPRLKQAEEYLDEARTCGHPLAKRWVEERLPLEVVEIEHDPYDDSDGPRTITKSIPIMDRLDVSSPILEREL